jgi:RNA polymerase sigma-70 factor (ECF subfamily)
MRAYLERGLGNISSKYREVLVLHYFEDMAYKDIADILQVPQGTVGIRIKRAKEALRAQYTDKNYE